MKAQNEDLGQRLHFIERTISHALHACCSDENVPSELREHVHMLRRRSSQAQHALQTRDSCGVRASVDDMARVSQRAQSAIRPTDHMDYAVKSAVILAHLEVSALRYQLD
jgi:hypothetical protein